MMLLLPEMYKQLRLLHCERMSPMYTKDGLLYNKISNVAV